MKKFLILAALFMPIITVKAVNITAEEISNKMQESIAGLVETKETALTLKEKYIQQRPDLIDQFEGIENLFDETKFEFETTGNSILVTNTSVNTQATITYNNSVVEYNYPGDKTKLNFKEYLFNDLISRILILSAYKTKGYDKNTIEEYLNSIDSATFTKEGFELTELVFNEGTVNEVSSIGSLRIDLNKIEIPGVSVPKENKKQTLTTDNDEFIISFIDDANNNYILEVNSFMEIMKLNIDNKNNGEESKTLNEKIKRYTDHFKKYGNLIDFYNIEVTNSSETKKEGPFTLKIKITEEMKKYNIFELIYVEPVYVDPENTDFVPKETYKVKVEGEYLVVEIPHLSIYALVGKEEKTTSETTKNPSTGIKTYGTIGLLTITILGGTYIILKKKMSN